VQEVRTDELNYDCESIKNSLMDIKGFLDNTIEKHKELRGLVDGLKNSEQEKVIENKEAVLNSLQKIQDGIEFFVPVCSEDFTTGKFLKKVITDLRATKDLIQEQSDTSTESSSSTYVTDFDTSIIMPQVGQNGSFSPGESSDSSEPVFTINK